jgi:hypothetical protein
MERLIRVKTASLAVAAAMLPALTAPTWILSLPQAALAQSSTPTRPTRTIAPVTPATPVAPQVTTPSVPTEVTIPDGTEITVTTIEEISSKRAKTGDSVTFRIEEDVIIDRKVVIKSGSLAKGVVADAKSSGHLGKSGRLSMRVESTTAVDGQRIKLRSVQSSEGGGNLGATVAVSVLVSPLGLLIKGKNAVVKAGTPIKTYVDGQMKIVVP